MSSSGFRETRSPFSFRDPAGRLFRVNGRLIRLVSPAFKQDLQAFLASQAADRCRTTGAMVATDLMSGKERETLLAQAGDSELRDAAQDAVLLEHERLPFPSFPYEWPPEMLHAAGSLTLDLAEWLLEEGLGLKDATPYNVLYRGSQPVFVDVLSVERREPGDATWLAYGQFVRTFLLPLLVNKHLGLPLGQLLLSNRDGLEPEEVYRMCGFWRKLQPSVLLLATLPTLLSPRAQDSTKLYEKRLVNRERARYTLRSLFKGLRGRLRQLAPAEARRSPWSQYMGSGDSYTEQGFNAKRSLVESVLAEFQPRRVLDVGCNRGEFSSLAAKSGANVVAIDADPVVVGATWRRAREKSLDILPLVVNLARPSPGVGWRNQECSSFLERACGAFDAVLMLAVLHHLMVGEGVPLEEVLDLTAELTTDWLLIEYIDPADKMFQQIVRGRNYLYTGLTRESFEAACRRRFHVLRSERVPGAERWLYCLRKTKAHAAAA